MSVDAESLSANKHESGKQEPKLPNRIEIKTLVQWLDTDAETAVADSELESYRNDGRYTTDVTYKDYPAADDSIDTARYILLERTVAAPAQKANAQAAAAEPVVDPAAKDETAEVVGAVGAVGARTGSPVPDSWALPVGAPVAVPLPVGDLVDADQRPLLDDVAYGWACMSGLYRPDELREIGLREALHAGIVASWARQECNGVTWESLLNRLLVTADAPASSER